MSLHDAMRTACDSIGIVPPRRNPTPGRWVLADTLGKNGKGDGRVLVFDDLSGGIAWNHQTGQHAKFKADSANTASPPNPALERERRAREARRQEEQADVARLCEAIVKACRPDHHDYLRAKGFGDETGLVIDHPRDLCPDTPHGRLVAAAMPEGGPFLIVPGRIGGRVTTVQFIGPDGAKKNILHGHMAGASHRIAQGRETWVAEGIATALSVRAGLKLLGRSATVLCAFAANNVAAVAKAIPGAIIAADHDKPVPTLGGLGTGEYYAVASGCRWVMPPTQGDFNDLHQAEGLRSVALVLRGIGMG